MKSILFCSTSVTWALLFFFSVMVILSTFASATSSAPASLTVVKFGLRSIVMGRGASTLLIMNGPLDGGGLLVASLSSRVRGGIGAANMSPSLVSKVAFGSVSWIVISPVVSSVGNPLIVFG